MGAMRPAAYVKLIVGLLSGDPDLLRRARQRLHRRFGEIDFESPRWPFDHTDYYAAEMGPDLQRWFLAFDALIRPDALVEIKQFTNDLEAEIADETLRVVARPVNLDPGYLHLGKLVLASTKDRAHRIYLGGGIYAEVCLHYRDGQWCSYPWTYPDYQRPEYHEFFTVVRNRLMQQRDEYAIAAPPRDEDAP